MVSDLIQIYKHFGKDNQIEKLKEEFQELLDAIASEDQQKIVDELADMHVLLKQFQYANDISLFDLELTENYKVKRTLERIKSGYYENNV